MHNGITTDMLNELNHYLSMSGCCFKYTSINGPCNDLTVEIVPISRQYIKSFILNITQDFRQCLIEFFNNKGVKIEFNNDGSIFWASHKSE